MLQQVNLYKLLPQKKVSFLTKKFVLVSYTVFFLLLTLLYVRELLQNARLNHEMALVARQTQTIQLQLSTLTQRYPLIDVEALKKNVTLLQGEYVKKANTIDLLSHFANFSNFLIALGQIEVPGVWLTEITFNRTDVNIELKGYTLQPSDVEKFFARLTGLPAFANYSFKVNEIHQSSFPASFYITAKQVAKI